MRRRYGKYVANTREGLGCLDGERGHYRLIRQMPPALVKLRGAQKRAPQAARALARD